MKRESVEEPVASLVSPTRHRVDGWSKRASVREKERSAEERGVHKLSARYDAFQGILKRVTEMKLNGSLDSEEPSSGSEKSESSKCREPKRRGQFDSCSGDQRSSVSAFEDDSCCSSVTGSDHCPPYEEVSRPTCRSGYARSTPPPCPAYAEAVLPPYRESFPPPPSPTDSYESVSSERAPKEYKAPAEVGRGDFEESSRPKSSTAIPERLAADINDNSTDPYGRDFAVDQTRHPQGISDAEKHQLEMFFRSLKTHVYVCGSLANLYFGWKEEEGKWTYRHTGLVVVLFDSGDTRSRSKRKIQIVLAERGTCFPLWKDTIDNLSAYRKSATAFHTMHLSCDHRQMVGLSFDSPPEAEALLHHLEDLTSNPENINISVPTSARKRKPAPNKKPPPLPHKKHISNPCLFHHLTSVSLKDKPLYMSLQTLLDDHPFKHQQNIP